MIALKMPISTRLRLELAIKSSSLVIRSMLLILYDILSIITVLSVLSILTLSELKEDC